MRVLNLGEWKQEDFQLQPKKQDNFNYPSSEILTQRMGFIYLTPSYHAAEGISMLTTDQRIGDDLILERMYAAEQGLLTQADALDMKASYLLIVLVFLAQLSATFIARHDLSWLLRGSQWLSCFLLIISAIFILCELSIKSFQSEGILDLEAMRERAIIQAKELDQYKQAAHPNEYVRGRLIWSLIKGCRKRICTNDAINAKKVIRLKWAYGLAMGAFVLDILFILRTALPYSFL